MSDKKQSDTPQPAGVWVSKDEYNQYKIRQATDVRKARRADTLSTVFCILFAIGGLIVAVAFVGGLVIPVQPTGNRSCTGSWFDGIKAILNLIGYPLLLATGIFGATINRAAVRGLGIILIVLAPIIGMVVLIGSFISALCGA